MSSDSGSSPEATPSPHRQEVLQLSQRLAKLERSEQQFRTLADNIPQLAWIADEHGWIFWYNRRWYDYTGATPEQMEGWGWRKVHHPAHVARVVDRITRSFQTGEPWEDIFPLRGRSGEYRWFLSRAMPIRDGRGKLLWWFGTNTDVTEQRDTELALRESERELAATFEQAVVGIVHVDLLYYRFQRANRAFCDMLGRAADELTRLTIRDVLHPADVASCELLLQEVVAGKRSYFMEEKRFLHRDGSHVWARVTMSPVRQDDGSMGQIIALIEDITDAKRTEQELHEARTRIELAARIAEIGFWEWHTKTGEVYFSTEWKRQLGYGEHELQNRFEEFRSRVHHADLAGLEDTLRQYFRQPWDDYSVEFRMRHRDGSYRWIWSRARASLDEHGRVEKMVGTHLDVTERKEAENRMRHLAQHDVLTGLPNRSLIYEFASQFIASAKRNGHRLAVMFFDLDRFKPVNDTYGHEVGDKMLVEVAHRLRRSVREEDVVGRLGGDEFMAMLVIRSDADISHAAEHLLESLRWPYAIGDIQLNTSPSIGVAVYPRDGADIDTLIRHADAAMYHAKESGRNRIEFFNEDIQRGLQRSVSTEQRLRHGLSRGEFALHYQPIVSTGSGRIDGLEALIRWQPAEAGGLQPAEFIPIAETSGLINSLGEWAMREACRQHEAWRSEGLPPLRMAVNVSPVQFRSKDFPARMERLIVETGIDPACLEIELTETTIMKHVEEAARTLAALNDLGVSISVDDFGTGYSSLNYLSILPIDKIKVDRSFIVNIERDQRLLVITEAMIALAKKLGVKVVAEGIESPAALDLLRERGCDLAQGFLLGRPLPVEAVTPWFREHASVQ